MRGGAGSLELLAVAGSCLELLVGSGSCWECWVKASSPQFGSGLKKGVVKVGNVRMFPSML